MQQVVNTTFCNHIFLAQFFHFLSSLLSQKAEKYGIILFAITYTLTLFAGIIEEKSYTDVSCSTP